MLWERGQTDSRWLQAAVRRAGGAKGSFVDAVRRALDTVSAFSPENL